jgi:ephrin-B
MIYYSTSNVSTSGVFEYPLNPPITANSGDILAVSQPNDGNSIIRIFYKEDTGLSFKSRTVKFGANFYNPANQPLQTHQLILVYPITVDGCINSSVNSSIIKQYALTVTDTLVFNAEGQYIYPEINFTCNGTITKWIFGGENQTNEQFYLTPELQIWRKRNDSKYMKVGNSSILDYTNISTNVYELVPKSPLKFQQGDFFGVYIPNNTKTLFKLYEQRNNGPVNLKVEGNIEEPQSITLKTVGNNYPLVTIETDQTDNTLITTYITLSVVLTLVLLVVSVVIICVIGCRKYMKTSGSLRGVQGQDNPLYDSNDHSKPIKAIYESFSAVYISIESSLEASELLANEEIHQPVEYEVPETSNNKKKIEGKHVNSHDERYDNPVITQVCNHSPRENFFIEEEIYWEPGSDTESIYEQISKKNYRIIARQDITITKYLGSGEFGTVNQGIWNSPHGPIDVAIKMLNKKAAEEEKVLFLREGAIMGQFHHPNIVKIHGMVTAGEPVSY